MKWYKDSIKIAQRQIAVYRVKTAEYPHTGFMEKKTGTGCTVPVFLAVKIVNTHR